MLASSLKRAPAPISRSNAAKSKLGLCLLAEGFNTASKVAAATDAVAGEASLQMVQTQGLASITLPVTFPSAS